MKTIHDSSANMDELISRYFEALTTDEEERRLRRFLASPQGADSRYDDVRAVMGFLVTGKRLHAAPSRSRLRVRRWQRAAVAAVVILGLGGTWLTLPRFANDDVYIAYVGGEKITSPDAVFRQMEASMQAMVSPTGEPSLEQQLDDMFQIPTE